MVLSEREREEKKHRFTMVFARFDGGYTIGKKELATVAGQRKLNKPLSMCIFIRREKCCTTAFNFSRASQNELTPRLLRGTARAQAKFALLQG